MKNIEIKVRVDDRAEMIRLIRGLCGNSTGRLRQTDTYFDVLKGRLKLREEDARDTADLIFYSWPDSQTSRLSEYDIQTVPKAAVKKMKNLLAKALPVRVVVKKIRLLYMFRHTRIHLDHVSGLGDFLELETVIFKQKMSDARKEHAAAIRALGLDSCEKISVSYSDLLVANQKK